MSIADLANTPIEISFGGRTIKVERLTIKEIYAPAQARVKQDYIANMQLTASGLGGLEKMDYLVRATKDIPKGSILNQVASEYLATPDGIAEVLLFALNKHQKISEDEATQLLIKSTEEERALLFSYLSAKELTNPDTDTDKDKDKDTDQKKTVVQEQKPVILPTL